MPHWYLASWVWNAAFMGGTGCWQSPAGAVAAIDLRPQSAQAIAGGAPAGWGFFGFDAVQTLVGADYFGNDLTANQALAKRTAWRNKLGIVPPLDSARLIDILVETLGPKSDPTLGIRAKPLLPNQAGDLEVYLGTSGRVFQRQFTGTGDPHWARIQAVEQDDYRSVRNRCLLFANAIDNCIEGDGSLAARLVSRSTTNNGVSFSTARGVLAQYFRDKYKRYLGGLVQKYKRWAMARTLFIPADLADEGELLPQTTYTDDFNRADSTNLGADWAEVRADPAIKANTMAALYFDAGGSQTEARYEHDVSSSDHYAQCIAANFTPNDSTIGPCFRFDASARTYYYALEYWASVGGSGGSSGAYIQKAIAGSITNVGYQSLVVANGHVIKGEASGSTIKTYINGVQQVSITDTSITGNLRGGIALYNGWQTNLADVKADDFEVGDLAAAVAATRLLSWNTAGPRSAGGLPVSPVRRGRAF